MHPEPLFKIFGNGVYAYGICMAVGIIACFGFLFFTMWYKKFNERSTDAVLIIGLFGTGFGLFAAMLIQSLYNYIANPSGGFHLGGMTFIGGLVGGVVSFLGVWNLYVYVVGPRVKIKWLSSKSMNAGLSDALPFIPIGIAIAHAFGRFGCFWAGCCYGDLAEWGLPCASGWNSTLQMSMNGVNVIPTQLFEMSFLFVLAAVMALLYFKFKLNYNFGVYAIAYGVWRFTIEFFRIDDRGGVQGAALTPSQILSIVMVILGVGYFFLQYFVLSKMMKHPELKQPKVTGEPVPVECVTVAADGGNVTESVTECEIQENVTPVQAEQLTVSDGKGADTENKEENITKE